jgi:hypothetical protein
MSKNLILTFYKTDDDYERGTAILECHNPFDWKNIEVTFLKEDEYWVLQQPIDFKFRKISDPGIIFKLLNTDDNNPLFKLKIKKHIYPNVDEMLYIIESKNT